MKKPPVVTLLVETLLLKQRKEEFEMFKQMDSSMVETSLGTGVADGPEDDGELVAQVEDVLDTADMVAGTIVPWLVPARTLGTQSPCTSIACRLGRRRLIVDRAMSCVWWRGVGNVWRHIGRVRVRGAAGKRSGCVCVSTVWQSFVAVVAGPAACV